MTPEQRFGEVIRELRQRKEWTLRRAAEAVEITHQRLAELERGVARGTSNPTRPTKEVVGRLAIAYGVPRDYLLELAGYARERPLVSDDDGLVLDLYHSLDDERRRVALGMLRLLAEGPQPTYGAEGTSAD